MHLRESQISEVIFFLQTFLLARKRINFRQAPIIQLAGSYATFEESRLLQSISHFRFAALNRLHVARWSEPKRCDGDCPTFSVQSA
jgi:hypothetical protein